MFRTSVSSYVESIFWLRQHICLTHQHGPYGQVGTSVCFSQAPDLASAGLLLHLHTQTRSEYRRERLAPRRASARPYSCSTRY